ncbi:MAG: RsmB/NOP family class I SAM-dependent RNA methyltransferase [Synergistaceae bacterium]|jgi:16S rRNA (cytosine967-C5)-methyltransferase|nr:RsmB/NOP family class I SAM-dependent RNA methyltransferase [Synergistaceae bacterium]
MRGIKGALLALQSVRDGRFIGSALRSLGNEMPVKELSLASSLAYAALRRESLWRTVFETCAVERKREGKKEGKSAGAGMKKNQKFSPLVSDCLLVGTAGLLELRNFAGGVLVNGLLEILKERGQEKAVPAANAILRSVSRDGAGILEKFRRSPRLEERAMWAGIPGWTLPAWKKTWSGDELNELFGLAQISPRASLRTPPGEREGVLVSLRQKGQTGDTDLAGAEPSDLFPDSIRLASTVLPTLLPGFGEGRVTLQTESSMLAASLVKDFWRGGPVLDMCSGRGVKAGQIAQALPAAPLECWEISPGRHLAAAHEMERLGAGGRVRLRAGDALSLEPLEPPEVVLLDAPCTGSGTWNRKPEFKWKLNWAKLDKICAVQKNLLKKALSLAKTGGIIVYVTCSLLRQENENIVAEVLSERTDCVVLDVPWTGRHLRRGRPWGTYIWPSLPWLDGFYAAVMLKKA